MIREIVLDTETTGLDPAGDRLVEIGGVELVNHIPTGATFHVYINPDRPMSQGAFEVHGLSEAFLADKPRFDDVADGFLDFVADARLVIHNAAFDMGFINTELKRSGRRTIGPAQVVDTLALARRRHPAGPNSLDALCARYGVDASVRTKHGALLDSELLAAVYIELIGGRQADLALDDGRGVEVFAGALETSAARRRPQPLPPRLTDAERAAHAAFVATFGDKALWAEWTEIRLAGE